MAASFNLTAQLNLVGPSNVKKIAADIRREIGTVTGSVKFKIDQSAAVNAGKLNSQLRKLNDTLAQTRTLAADAAGGVSQLGSALGGVKLSKLSSDTAKSAKGISEIGDTSKKAAKDVQVMGSELAEFGRQSGLAIRRFAAFSIVSSVVYKLNSALSSAIGNFIDFDKELVRVSQVTGKDIAQLDGLVNEITKLSTSLGVTSDDLIKVSSTLAQAGLSASETEQALKALALSANAPSFDSLNDTVEGSIALMRQFGIKAKDLEQALGAVNAVSAQFAVEASDIITAIQRTGGVFATASRGVSSGTDALNEFIAVFTSIRATTRESAETIATGLRTIFARIQRKDTIDALKEYGVSLTDLEGKFVGPYEAVRRLSEGLSKLDPRDLGFSKIVEELGGFRQIGKVIPLIQQFATAEDALRVAQQGAGSLAADNAKAQLALANKLTKVREEFVSLVREFGKNTVLQSFLSLTLSLTGSLLKLVRAGKGLFPILTLIAGMKAVSGITQFAGGFAEGVRPKTKSGGGEGVAKSIGSNIGEILTGSRTDKESQNFDRAASSIEKSIDSLSSEIASAVPEITQLATSVQQHMVELSANTAALISNTSSIDALTQAISSLDLGGGPTLNAGGVVRKFAVGGVVPGSGDKDTVPAMLTPGEFVMRKSAVKAIGADKLHKMNKYAKGGAIAANIENTSANDGDSLNVDFTPADKPFNTSSRLMGYDAFETKDVRGQEVPSWQKKLGQAAKSIAAQKYDGKDKTALKAFKAADGAMDTYGRPMYKDDALGEELVSKGLAMRYDGTGQAPTKSLTPAAYKKVFHHSPSDALLDENTEFDISETKGYALGGLVQKFAKGGIAQRKVGYIDYDVIANEANKDTVEKGMKETGVSGLRLYSDHLIDLAVKARKNQNLGKLRAIYGVAGSGKTTLARGQGTDNATLRQTERFPVLSPEDIQRATEVIVLSSSVSKKKLDELFTETDRSYTLSSTTQAEKERVKAQRASRDITGVGLEGRQPGVTSNVATDTAVGEALLSDALGARSVVLGRTDSGRLRRKSGNELVDIIKKRIGFTWGGFAPMTAGHESIMDAAAAMGIPPEDFIYLVGANEGIKNGDPSSYRTAVFDQDTRVLLARAGAGSRGATVLPKPRDFEVPSAFDISPETGRRKVLIPDKGSTTFVADKGAEETKKYKEAGYDVANIERTGGISGTMVRDLIMAGDLGKLQSVLSPNVYDLISNNIGRIQNRANILPSLIEEVKQTHGVKLEEVEKEIKALGITRIDSKKLESDPEYAAKVEVLKQLRAKKDKIKSSASFEPYRLLAALAQKQPEKYGLDLAVQTAAETKPVRTVKKRQKANIGGQIQKFATGGYVVDFDYPDPNSFDDSILNKGLADIASEATRQFTPRRGRRDISIDDVKKGMGNNFNATKGNIYEMAVRAAGNGLKSSAKANFDYASWDPGSIKGFNTIASGTPTDAKISTDAASKDSFAKKIANYQKDEKGDKGKGKMARRRYGAAIFEPNMQDKLEAIQISQKEVDNYKKKANGGLIQRFMAGGIAEESEKMTEAIAATKSRKEIMDVLKRRPNGLEDTATKVGVDAFDIFNILGKTAPDAKTKALQEAIRREYVKAYNRQAGAAKGADTRTTNKAMEEELVFGAAGILGTAQETKNIKIESDRLSKTANVRVFSGVLDQNIAKRVDELLTGGVEDISSKAANIIKPGASGETVDNPNAMASIQGGILEMVVQKLGGPGTVKGLGFDFPNGLQEAAQYFGLPADIPTDLKRTLSRPSDIKDNIVTYLKNVKGYATGGYVSEYDIPINVGGATHILNPKEKAEKIRQAKAIKAQIQEAEKTIATLKTHDVKPGLLGSIMGKGTTNRYQQDIYENEDVIRRLQKELDSIMGPYGSQLGKFTDGGKATDNSLKPNAGFEPQEMLDAVTYYQYSSSNLARSMASKTPELRYIDSTYETSDVVDRLKAAAQYSLPKMIFSGLRKSKLSEIFASAGTDFNKIAYNKEGEFDADLAKKNIEGLAGNTVDFSTFLSTTESADIAKKFAGSKPLSGIMSIDTTKSSQKGIDVSKAKTTDVAGPDSLKRLKGMDLLFPQTTRYDNEQEHILPPGTKFKILKSQADMLSPDSTQLNLATQMLNSGGKANKPTPPPPPLPGQKSSITNPQLAKDMARSDEGMSEIRKKWPIGSKIAAGEWVPQGSKSIGVGHFAGDKKSTTDFGGSGWKMRLDPLTDKDNIIIVDWFSKNKDLFSEYKIATNTDKPVWTSYTSGGSGPEIKKAAQKAQTELGKFITLNKVYDSPDTLIPGTGISGRFELRGDERSGTPRAKAIIKSIVEQRKGSKYRKLYLAYKNSPNFQEGFPSSTSGEGGVPGSSYFQWLLAQELQANRLKDAKTAAEYSAAKAEEIGFIKSVLEEQVPEYKFAGGGKVKLYHGSTTGIDDNQLKKFKAEGALPKIAQGYGQGAGFYVWTDKSSAIRHADMRVRAAKEGNNVVAGGDTAGKGMTLEFQESLDPSTWDLDYEISKKHVVEWLYNNYDKLKDKIAPNRTEGYAGVRGINAPTETNPSKSIRVDSDTGSRKTIYADSDSNIREGELIGQIMNRLQANETETVHSFEKDFFSQQPFPQGTALKYVGSSPLIPTSIETFANGGVVPGVGNSDTVPAMLNAGDFVIRKSSVNKMGVKNIASVSEFASGGQVPALLTPGEFVIPKEKAAKIGYGKLNKMNKLGKFNAGGAVGGVQRFFVGGVAEKDAVRAQGAVLQNIGQAESEFASLLTQLPSQLQAAIQTSFKAIKQINATDIKDKNKGTTYETRRGYAKGATEMGFQIKGKSAAATTETVAHETGHVADFALGGHKGYSSMKEGSFQFDLMEKVKPQMEKAFKAAGYSAERIAEYLTDNKELFAEFFAKASPEVRSIITSTTDSAKGMAMLRAHLEKAGHTYAGLEASDIGSGPGGSVTEKEATSRKGGGVFGKIAGFFGFGKKPSPSPAPDVPPIAGATPSASPVVIPRPTVGAQPSVPPAGGQPPIPPVSNPPGAQPSGSKGGTIIDKDVAAIFEREADYYSEAVDEIIKQMHSGSASYEAVISQFDKLAAAGGEAGDEAKVLAAKLRQDRDFVVGNAAAPSAAPSIGPSSARAVGAEAARTEVFVRAKEKAAQKNTPGAPASPDIPRPAVSSNPAQPSGSKGGTIIDKDVAAIFEREADYYSEAVDEIIKQMHSGSASYEAVISQFDKLAAAGGEAGDEAKVLAAKLRQDRDFVVGNAAAPSAAPSIGPSSARAVGAEAARTEVFVRAKEKAAQQNAPSGRNKDDITKEIAVTSKALAAAMAKSKKQLESLDAAIAKQEAETKALYAESARLDGVINKYAQTLDQRSKEKATGVNSGKLDKRIAANMASAQDRQSSVDAKALESQQILDKMKARRAGITAPVEDLAKKKEDLIAEAKAAKQAEGPKPPKRKGPKPVESWFGPDAGKTVGGVAMARSTASSIRSEQEGKLSSLKSQRAELKTKKAEVEKGTSPEAAAMAAVLQAQINAVAKEAASVVKGLRALDKAEKDVADELVASYKKLSDGIDEAKKVEDNAKKEMDKAYSDVVSSLSKNADAWNSMTDEQKASAVEEAAVASGASDTRLNFEQAQRARQGLESERDTMSGGAKNETELKRNIDEAANPAMKAARLAREEAETVGAKKAALATGGVTSGKEYEDLKFKYTREAATERGLRKTVVERKGQTKTKEEVEKENKTRDTKIQQGSEKLRVNTEQLLIKAILDNTKTLRACACKDVKGDTGADNTDAIEKAAAKMEGLASEMDSLVQAKNDAENAATEADMTKSGDSPFDNDSIAVPFVNMLDSLAEKSEKAGNRLNAAFSDSAGNVTKLGAAAKGMADALAGAAKRTADGLATLNEDFVNTKVGKVFQGLTSMKGLISGTAITGGLAMAGEAAGGYETKAGTALNIGSSIAEFATSIGTVGRAFGPLGTAVGTAVGALAGLAKGLFDAAKAAEEQRIKMLELAKEDSAQKADTDFGVFFSSMAPDVKDLQSGLQNLSATIAAENEIIKSSGVSLTKRDFMGLGPERAKTGTELREASQQLAASRSASGSLAKNVISSTMKSGNTDLAGAQRMLGSSFGGLSQAVASADASYVETVQTSINDYKAGKITKEALIKSEQAAKDAVMKRIFSEQQVIAANEEFNKAMAARQRLESQGTGVLEKIIGNTSEQNREYNQNINAAEGLFKGDASAQRALEQQAYEEAYAKTGGTEEEKQKAGEQAQAKKRSEITQTGNEFLNFLDPKSTEYRNAKANMLETQLKSQGVDTTTGMAGEVLKSLRKEDPTLEAQKKTEKALLANQKALVDNTAAIENAKNPVEDILAGGTGLGAGPAGFTQRAKEAVLGNADRLTAGAAGVATTGLQVASYMRGGKVLQVANQLAAGGAAGAAQTAATAGKAAAGATQAAGATATAAQAAGTAGKIGGFGLKAAGGVLGKVAAPLALIAGGVMGGMEAKEAGRTTTEGVLYGALTGGAKTGSMFSGMLGVEKGSTTDKALGVAGAAGAGALTGATIGSVVPVIGTAVGAVVGAITGGAAEILKIFTEGGKSIGEGIKNIGSAIWNGVGALPGLLYKYGSVALAAIWSGTKSLASFMYEAGSAAIQSLWSGLKALPGVIYDTAAAAIPVIWSGLQQLPGLIYEGGAAALSMLWSGASALSSVLFEVGSTALSGIWSGIKSLPGVIYDTAVAVIPTIWTGLTNLPGFIYESAMSAFGMIWTGITTVVPAIVDGVTYAFANIGKFLGEAGYAAVTGIVEVFQGIPGFITETVPAALTAGANALYEAIINFAGWVGDQFIRVFTNIGNAINDAVYGLIKRLPGGESIAKGLGIKPSEKPQTATAEAGTKQGSLFGQTPGKPATPLMPGKPAGAGIGGATIAMIPPESAYWGKKVSEDTPLSGSDARTQKALLDNQQAIAANTAGLQTGEAVSGATTTGPVRTAESKPQNEVISLLQKIEENTRKTSSTSQESAKTNKQVASTSNQQAKELQKAVNPKNIPVDTMKQMERKAYDEAYARQGGTEQEKQRAGEVAASNLRQTLSHSGEEMLSMMDPASSEYRDAKANMLETQLKSQGVDTKQGMAAKILESIRRTDPQTSVTQEKKPIQLYDNPVPGSPQERFQNAKTLSEAHGVLAEQFSSPGGRNENISVSDTLLKLGDLSPKYAKGGELRPDINELGGIPDEAYQQYFLEPLKAEADRADKTKVLATSLPSAVPVKPVIDAKTAALQRIEGMRKKRGLPTTEIVQQALPEVGTALADLQQHSDMFEQAAGAEPTTEYTSQLATAPEALVSAATKAAPVATKPTNALPIGPALTALNLSKSAAPTLLNSATTAAGQARGALGQIGSAVTSNPTLGRFRAGYDMAQIGIKPAGQSLAVKAGGIVGNIRNFNYANAAEDAYYGFKAGRQALTAGSEASAVTKASNLAGKLFQSKPMGLVADAVGGLGTRIGNVASGGLSMGRGAVNLASRAAGGLSQIGGAMSPVGVARTAGQGAQFVARSFQNVLGTGGLGLRLPQIAGKGLMGSLGGMAGKAMQSGGLMLAPALYEGIKGLATTSTKPTREAADDRMLAATKVLDAMDLGMVGRGLDLVRGGSGQSLSEIAGETMALDKTTTSSQATILPKVNTEGDIIDRKPQDKMTGSDFKHLSGMRLQLAKYTEGGKIGGKDLATEFDQIDFNDASTQNEMRLAIAKARAEQSKVIAENQGVLPMFMRSDEGAQKLREAQNQDSMLEAAQKELGMVENVSRGGTTVTDLEEQQTQANTAAVAKQRDAARKGMTYDQKLAETAAQDPSGLNVRERLHLREAQGAQEELAQAKAGGDVEKIAKAEARVKNIEEGRRAANLKETGKAEGSKDFEARLAMVRSGALPQVEAATEYTAQQGEQPQVGSQPLTSTAQLAGMSRSGFGGGSAAPIGTAPPTMFSSGVLDQAKGEYDQIEAEKARQKAAAEQAAQQTMSYDSMSKQMNGNLFGELPGVPTAPPQGNTPTPSPGVISNMAQPNAAGTPAVSNLAGIDPAAISEALSGTFNNFITALQNIQLPKIPETITMEGRHTVEVIINGAEALKSIDQGIREMVTDKINEAMKNINNKTEGGFGP